MPESRTPGTYPPTSTEPSHRSPRTRRRRPSGTSGRRGQGEGRGGKKDGVALTSGRKWRTRRGGGSRAPGSRRRLSSNAGDGAVRWEPQVYPGHSDDGAMPLTFLARLSPMATWLFYFIKVPCSVTCYCPHRDSFKLPIGWGPCQSPSWKRIASDTGNMLTGSPRVEGWKCKRFLWVSRLVDCSYRELYTLPAHWKHSGSVGVQGGPGRWHSFKITPQPHAPILPPRL